MARPEHLYLSGHSYHVVQSSTRQQCIFKYSSDYIHYLNCLQDALLRYGVSCHAYVLLGSRVHLLLTPGCTEGVARVMRLTTRRYTQPFEQRAPGAGHLREGQYRSCALSDDVSVWAAQRHIEWSPVHARMALHPGDYYWSSYACNALGVFSDVVTPHSLYLGLGQSDTQRQCSYRALLEQKPARRPDAVFPVTPQQGLSARADASPGLLQQAPDIGAVRRRDYH